MDDPGIAWPAWKFGMKRDALFTTLHKEYNTFQSTIQDPDAFHHDVFEIANEASTTKEFHRLLSVRRDQRLRELNESLESASFEIIANPALVGTTQWEYALQLFRTRSLDSLVRYFASYLPSSHPWHQSGCHAQNVQHDPESEARNETAVAASKPFFDDAILTQEPAMMPHSLSCSSLHHHHDLPPSPRSLTTYSDDMETSSHELYCLNTLTPARTLSFDSEEGNSKTVDDVVDDDDEEEFPSQFDDDTSQSSGPDTPVSMSDAEPEVAEEDSHHHHQPRNPAVAFATMHRFVDAKTPPTSTPTPTPTSTKHEAIADAATPANNNITADAIATNTTPTKTSPSPSPRRPLQSGFAGVDDASSRPASPMPVSLRVRHRSVSPTSSSRTCWPVPVQADSGRHHHHLAGPVAVSVPGGIIAARRGRLASRSSHAAHHSSSTRASSVGRRRLGLGFGPGAGAGVEKIVLPRPMRTRLRERREAAASAAAAVEQERQ